MANDISNALAILLAGIASISLFVGGVGIMNIMLVSVTERTRKRNKMAIGAKKKDIMMQFLIESVSLSMLED
jgi:putative ABC transport system permease protein